MSWIKSTRSGMHDCVEVNFHKSSSSYQSDCVEVAVPFHKSSFSGDGECVEVAGLDFTKSTYSSTQGSCVETATCACNEVLVRDSKDREGPVLRFTPAEWTAFVQGVKAGEFG